MNFEDDFGNWSVQKVNQVVSLQRRCNDTSSCCNFDSKKKGNASTISLDQDDSLNYINKLEKKLEKIKYSDTRRRGNLSQELLHSLQEMKEAQFKAMMADDLNISTSQANTRPFVSDDPLSRGNYGCCFTIVYARLYPERQAVSNIEVDCLLDHDEVDEQYKETYIVKSS
ncbi:uncharacterized protein TRIADDRAFT_59827 [Trichoplax adhaerens]|uniref:Uncharacterized protein n=1 Tax=Trichoplax adhaerens TaxID=10228 RepID=B3S6J5_TRIAD|nr:predicted protein [Trichoplax adhaerens]EDV21629.1 predicted protein [Trichoplax adhaerens]|eukprot:XP_002115777.1 predicted protein [Trichoplax adhaerens]